MVHQASLLFKWRRLITEGGQEAVRAEDQVVAAAEVRELKRQIRELERLLGKKTLERDPPGGRGAREVKKTALARTVAARGGFPMKTIADTLGVARSNLMEQVCRTPRRRQAYRKADDVWLLPLVRSIVDERPTYGYRRVGALLSRQVATLSKPAVNHKRVYRLMRQNSLLLARHTGTGRQRLHDGVVRTLRSNLRWCSDVFENPFVTKPG